MNIFKEAWFWIVAISIIVSGGIIFFNDGINIFLDREVIIVVNEEKMDRKEFSGVLKQAEQNYSQVSQSTGEDFSEEDIKQFAIDMAVEQLLFLSYAKKLNISLSKQEIEDFYEEIIGQDENISSVDDLFKSWEEDGFNRKEMERQVNIYLLYDKIYKKYEEEVETTKEDLEKAYEEYLSWMKEVGSSSEEDVMPFEEIKEELRSFLVQEKAIEKMEEDIEKFREESKIEILI
jgi:hypothetical protein